jgi:hypothetical protein
MNAEQKIKHMIILEASKCQYYGKYFDLTDINDTNVDKLYSGFLDGDNTASCIQDTEYEFRSGRFETDIDPDADRHYESSSVATQYIDGSWIGWTYWYGGGKHGEPEAMDWMNEAYILNCKEEEKTVIVREFSKAE